MNYMEEYDTPAIYACHHNNDRVRVIAWCDTFTTRFGIPLPFVVDCWDDKWTSYYYNVYGGPNGEEFLTEWPKHWKWKIFDPT